MRNSAKEYYFYDAKSGTEYCTTTNTGHLPYESMEHLRYEIHDAGDYTAQIPCSAGFGRVHGVRALGTSRI